MHSALTPASAESLRVAGELLRQGRTSEAVRRIDLALTIQPHAVELHLFRALGLRNLGDPPGAQSALDAAFALDPRHFVALLSKGALLERQGRAAAAALVYRDALEVGLDPDSLPEPLGAQARHARAFVRARQDRLYDHLVEALAPLRAALEGPAAQRCAEALDVFTGRAEPYPQRSPSWRRRAR